MKVLVVMALLAGTLTLTGTACGGDDDGGAAEPAPTVTGTVTETGGGTTIDGDPGEGTTTDETAQGDVASGEQVFALAGCGGCHTLAAAGTNGSVGPDLDDASPSYDKVIERVTEGQGTMPSFEDDLSSQEIADVAAFVSGSVED